MAVLSYLLSGSSLVFHVVLTEACIAHAFFYVRDRREIQSSEKKKKERREKKNRQERVAEQKEGGKEKG